MSGLRILRIKRSVMLAGLCLLATGSAFADLPWQHDVRAALSQSKASGKPMMIQFTAEWCGFCHKMKATTFADPAVQRQVNSQFIPVMLDADVHAELVEKLSLKGLPATVVVDQDLRILKKLNGYQKAAKLQAELTSVLATRRKVSAVAYSKTQKPKVTAKAPAPPAHKPRALPKVRPTAPPKKQVAFQGLCLVSLRNDRSLQRGNPTYSLQYRGVVVSFATASEMETFRADPEKFWPKHDGVCQVSVKDGKRTQGRAEFGVMFQEEVWLFSSIDNMNRFVASPETYAVQ